MSKYPFREKVKELLEVRRPCISEVTYGNLLRRYNKMEREMIMLYESKKISTLSPSKMTVDDVRAYLLYRKEMKKSGSDYSHDISALNQLLLFCDNTAVTKCMQTNFGLKPVHHQRRLEPLSEDTYRRILAKWEEIDQFDFVQVRAFAVVLMYIGTGARNKELRLAKISDLDTKRWLVHLEHVKGEGSYGHPRNVPIPKEIHEVVLAYLRVRDAWLITHRVNSDALFISMSGDCSYLSSNSIRKIKKHVEDAIGETFELRDCRRACGQFYLNKGMSIEDVSILLGHDTSQTTETYYCRRLEDSVIEKAQEMW